MYDCTVIHEDPDFIVIDKPAGIASAPLHSQDTHTALHQAAALFPDILKVSGRKLVEYGLVHRIDTATRGLLLIALNQKAYDSFLKIQESDLFFKEYKAVCSLQPDCAEKLSGFPALPEILAEKINKLEYSAESETDSFCIRSSFRAFGPGRTCVRPVTDTSGKFAQKKGDTVIYKTEIVLRCIKKHTFSVHCRISKGYRHQVRCHLSWSTIPVIGDQLYNPEAIQSNTNTMQFFATALEFPHPANGQLLRIELPNI